MLHAVRFINSSTLMSGMAYPGMQRVPTRNRNLINSRFGFLSCITGLTSVCLFGLTIAINLTSLNNDSGQICPRQYRASSYRNDIVPPRMDAENRQCKVDLILKVLAFFFTFGASVEIQLRRKRNLLFLPTSGINRISDVLLLLLLGSTLFSLMALFNFVRLLFFISKRSPTDMNTNTDISLVYLSLLFILTLFNLLTTFIYCSKNRLHSQPDSNCEEELKQASDDPPCYNEVMANEKLYPIEKSSISADLLKQLNASSTTTNNNS